MNVVLSLGVRPL